MRSFGGLPLSEPWTSRHNESSLKSNLGEKANNMIITLDLELRYQLCLLDHKWFSQGYIKEFDDWFLGFR